MKHMPFCFGGQLLGQQLSILGGLGQEIGMGQFSLCCCMGLWVEGHLILTTVGFGQHLKYNNVMPVNKQADSMQLRYLNSRIRC